MTTYLLRKNNIIIIIAILMVFLQNNVKSQSGLSFSDINEKVYVHTDKKIYIAGEVMRYKAYLVNVARKEAPPCSRILYFVFTDASGISRLSWRININDGYASGSLIIPADMNSGIYSLKSYTNLMRNSPSETFFSQDLIIVSLSHPVSDTLTGYAPMNSLTHAAPEKSKGEYALTLTSSKQTYEAGEMAYLKIKLTGSAADKDSANLSVSVSLLNPLDYLTKEEDITTCLASAGNSGSDGSRIYRMENKVFILSGRIINRKNPVDISDRKIVLAINDSIEPAIICTKTGSKGEFSFYLGRKFDNRLLYVQFGDDSDFNNFLWEFDNKNIKNSATACNVHVLNEDEKSYLNSIKDLRLIEAVFYDETNLQKPDSSMRASRSFFTPDMIVRPREYIEFVNFKEMADNILPFVKFVKRGSENILKVYNKRTGLFESTEMILLNGVPFKDMNYVATLGTKEINRVEIVSRNTIMGNISLPGIVSVFTYNCRIPEDYLSQNVVKIENKVLPIDSKIESAKFNRRELHSPDFRNLLYWNPMITCHGRKPLTIKFPVSYLNGVFTVYVRGVASSSIPLSAETEFSVR